MNRKIIGTTVVTMLAIAACIGGTRVYAAENPDSKIANFLNGVFLIDDVELPEGIGENSNVPFIIDENGDVTVLDGTEAIDLNDFFEGAIYEEDIELPEGTDPNSPIAFTVDKDGNIVEIEGGWDINEEEIPEGAVVIDEFFN